MKPQRLGVHNQHDQSPGELKKKNSIVNICNVHTFYCSTLFSSFPGSDEIRQRNTAQARISGPASFSSKALKLEIIESISWTSDKVKTDTPFLRNCKTSLQTIRTDIFKEQVGGGGLSNGKAM
jgi:hypothetical protein